MKQNKMPVHTCPKVDSVHTFQPRTLPSHVITVSFSPAGMSPLGLDSVTCFCDAFSFTPFSPLQVQSPRRSNLKPN